ncbi:MAG: nickel pincer cofactor biosynthesis protein LarC [Haloferacaceae archaeon]
MDTIAFDGRAGAAGDMVLGALLAVGADRGVLAPVEDALGVRYRTSEADRAGVAATRVEVTRDGKPIEGERGHRHYGEVVTLVEEMGLPGPVERDALATFELLGDAEAAVHGTERERTQFHEVGADDAVADVVGAALLFDDLDPDHVVTTPLAPGGGAVEMRHGTYPVPAPAVVELAARADWSLAESAGDRELLTPTGAAVLAHHATGVPALPTLRVEEQGFGAGAADPPDRPNALRAIVGERDRSLRREPITVLETNVDDTPPEVLGSLHERLREAGARDVSVLPATMKKSRPGHLVRVVVRPEDAARAARALAAETGTLGVREHGAGHRWVAERRVEEVSVEAGGESHAVRVKVATDEAGDLLDASAEHDDALAVARATDLTVREAARRAETAWHERDGG